MNACLKKISERKLNMQVVTSEYTFDGRKVVFFFTADGRIDFRALVKDLARIFKVRIELKQIGVRDEAGITDGYGPCGRRMCCASWLQHFDSINVKMAKIQRLSLNPEVIGGMCGRLKCCLNYEYDQYRKLGKRLPREGTDVDCPAGLPLP